MTTRGRRTGKPHAVTIWFVVGGDDRIHLGTLRLGRDWPKNVAVHRDVTVEIGDLRLKGEATRVTDPECCEQVARLLARKYWAARIASWLGFRPQGVFEVRLYGAA
jgi:hypothetical protein